jgi:ATP-dependent helicase HrpB
MTTGTSAVLPSGSLLTREEFLAIGEVDGLGTDVRVFLAAPLQQQQLEKVFADDLVHTDEVYWSEHEKKVIARKVIKLGAVILAEQNFGTRGEHVIEAMLDGIRQMGIQCLPWEKETRELQQRVQWLRRHSSLPENVPDSSDEALFASLEEWLAPFLDGIRRADQLQKLLLKEILQSRFTHTQRKELERLAPSHLKLPSGSIAALDYSGDQPVLAVRLQELFGQIDTPKICNGKVNVLIHLLSPARRPLAVTQDLHSFWTTVYPEIRTQMRARYPKHIWPENPLKAKPTNKTIKRKR